jgi:hypothetical protein
MRNLVDSSLLFFKVKIPFLVYRVFMLTVRPAYFAFFTFVKLIIWGNTAKELETENIAQLF